MSEYVVELKNITKRFPGVVALKNMSIGIRPGEIHGLIGENGAGKSTLIKVLTGVHTPEEGEIYVDGQKVVFHNPVQSREAGIACVYQELNIVKQLSVTDNVFMGRAVKKNGLLDYPRMYEEAKQALTTLGHPEIDVKMECGKLGTGQQQMVEIAKVMNVTKQSGSEGCVAGRQADYHGRADFLPGQGGDQPADGDGPGPEGQGRGHPVRLS